MGHSYEFTHTIIIGTASSVCSGSSTQVARRDLQHFVSDSATSIQTKTTQQVPRTAGVVPSPLVTAHGRSSDIRLRAEEKKVRPLTGIIAIALPLCCDLLSSLIH